MITRIDEDGGPRPTQDPPEAHLPDVGMEATPCCGQPCCGQPYGSMGTGAIRRVAGCTDVLLPLLLPGEYDDAPPGSAVTENLRGVACREKRRVRGGVACRKKEHAG